MIHRDLAPLFNLSVVVVSVSYGLLHTFAMLFGLLGLALRILLWLSAWRYAYTVLRSLAQGHRELSTPGPEVFNPFAEFPLVVHFVLFPVLIGVIADLQSVPEPIRWAAVAALAGVFPASAAVMAMTGNFALALSPWHVAGVIGRLGRGYARLLALCAAVGVALVAVRAVPWPVLLDTIVANTADLWAFLGMFALTGALIREHRAEFEIPGELEPAEERAERERRLEWQHSLDRAYASIRSGLLAEGYAKIDEIVASEGGSVVVYQWLLDSMLRWEHKTHALRVARPYVDRLLEAGEVHEALDLFAQCRRISERFTVAPESARTLAAYARSIGREALAEDLEAAAARE